jgi:glucose-6-phosphate isomerase
MEIDLTSKTPDVRSLNDIKGVLADQEFAKTTEDAKLYFMYRGIEEKDGIRYDITVVPAKVLGSEFVKTKGHYHVGKYGEVYTVLEGQALYLMQKKKSDNEIEDAYVVRANKGDVVVIPSDYGHITINPSTTTDLKMANWVAADCKSDYSLFEKLQGACYYYLTDGTWVKNERYLKVPELRFEGALRQVPEDLSFLKIH